MKNIAINGKIGGEVNRGGFTKQSAWARDLGSLSQMGGGGATLEGLKQMTSSFMGWWRWNKSQ